MPELWERATRPAFLVAVRDGHLPADSFDTWLAEDNHFVGDLLWFQARLLARAPRSAQPVLATGAVALVDELAWFGVLAAQRSLHLDASPLPATLAYRQLLERLDRAGPDDALTALWVIERTYLEAWRFAAPGAEPFREVVEHWTTPGFAAYVDALAVACSTPAEAVANEVLEHEIAFWEMAWSR